jgi:NDP-sugar pyrophosphorylase family protein/mannose-6-phosphate isomerase-like protein (cupin superfamily)
MNIIYKPWGKEEWLELNNNYCYKRIYINKGYKTSYQYHEKKYETNYIISGEAEIWLENDKGIIEIKKMRDGDYFNVKPLKKHRVIAITDLILQEVSTPEIDDVIRIEDDSSRPNGRINNEHKKPAFCIVSSGKGTRMYHLTKNINKALLPINGKAVISYIIDKIPNDYDIIITTGYKKETLKEYCLSAHSDKNIKFIDVDNFESDNTGPGYSLLKAKEYLQRPFYFSTVDCLIEDKIPPLDSDWIGVSDTSIPELYSTAKIDSDNNVIDFKNKSKDGYKWGYIGLSGIYNYEKFWNSLEKNINNTGEFVNVYFDKDYKVKAKKLKWHDTGTIENYSNIKKIFEKNYFILNKNDEYFYDVNNKIIKIFIDKNISQNRIRRSDILKNYIPKITYKGEYTYSYEKFKGKTLYELDNIDIFKDFLIWLKSFWKIDESINLKKDALLFYKEKTLKRLELFKEKRPNLWKCNNIIDFKFYESLEEMVNNINWNKLLNVLPSNYFHGDLQFDNVIYNGDEFKLIDWRQSFGDSTEYGDIYYDLSKLYGGILISYYDMKKNNFSIEDTKDGIFLNYKPSKNLIKFKHFYENWIIEEGYDLNKIKLLTFIIYINMIPLHDEPFDLFLFYFAKKLFGDVNK